jgi:hypothetical protein
VTCFNSNEEEALKEIVSCRQFLERRKKKRWAKRAKEKEREAFSHRQRRQA